MPRPTIRNPQTHPCKQRPKPFKAISERDPVPRAIRLSDDSRERLEADVARRTRRAVCSWTTSRASCSVVGAFVKLESMPPG